MTLDPQRRSALLARKLGALVRDHAGEAPVVLEPFSLGAALMRGAEAWVLLDHLPSRGVGPALAWLRQRSWTGPVNLLVDDAVSAAIVARRAAHFDQPIDVWRIDGRALVPAEPLPLDPEPKPDPRSLALVPLICEAGAEPTVEFGVVAGEVVGLEVCRVAVDETGAYLEVGIGPNDGEAFTLLHGRRPRVDDVRRVVETIAVHRAPGAEPHALNRIARERALRSWIVHGPESVGALVLETAAPPVPRDNLKYPVPCVARGIDAEGRNVTVVCSTGVDLDLVPFAGDARLAAGGGELVIAVPAADRHPATIALAARLMPAARVVAVDPH